MFDILSRFRSELWPLLRSPPPSWGRDREGGGHLRVCRDPVRRMSATLTLLAPSLIQQYRAASFWRDDTIYALAGAHARRAPGRAAARDRFRRVSFGELLAAADRLADDLANGGMRPGPRVAVWLPSRIECAVALLACSRSGYVLTPSFHRDHTVGDVLALVERVGAAAFIGEAGYGADADRRDIFSELGRLDSLRHVWCLGPAKEPGSLFAETDVLVDQAPAPPKMDPDAVVYLAFTSGTTGLPKGVMHSDNTLLANARAMAADWRIDETSVVYSLSPLSHNLGFGAMVMALSAGA